MKTYLLFFWFVFTGSALVSALPCMNTSFFTPFSTYDTNRRLVLASLASNVTVHRGFYNTSFGQPPNRVYAVGMCIPGVDPEICSGCITIGSHSLISTCPNNKEASGWQEYRTHCFVRYSFNPFVGSLNLEPRLDLINSMDLTKNESDFSRAWKELSRRLILSASSSKDESWSSSKYYAIDVEVLSDSQSLYGLMQCTPDLSPADCNLCLRKSVSNYQKCCLAQEGGIIIRLSCFFRVELHPFFGAFRDITAVSPSSEHSPTSASLTNQTNFTNTDGERISTGTIVGISVSIVVIIIIIIILGLLAKRYAILCWRRKSYQDIDLGQSVHSLQFDLKTIEAATNKFSERNKIGEGGFGEVFKGTLPSGTEVAVKRLSRASDQGAPEFKNEVVVVAKLQHKNLVRLLGFCLEGVEKILLYEFVPNKSLDYFLFDATKQGQLDWMKRLNIILGITRGILYLHEDSRLTIIHRDLKASNILLDADMIPKIADFGMARIFGMEQTRDKTCRIAGTYGYMSPEYAMHGQISMKSDVYSFGVLVLEIICGRKNSSFHNSESGAENIVTYAWRLWKNRTPLVLVDPIIAENYQSKEVERCIHIALLCVQENPTDRPNLSTINLMLTSDTMVLSDPQQPGFFFSSSRNQERDGFEYSQSTTARSNPHTINDVTITDLDPR